MTIFYFTATGNSLAVAKQIGGTLISIPQVVDSDNAHYKDDAIGIVFPIYWWSVPIMVRRFLDRATFESDYVFAVGTYGNFAGGAMVSLQNQAKLKGYSFDYSNHLLMLDNYLPVFEMGVQAKKFAKRPITENAARIASDINSRKHMNAKAHLGKRAMTSLFRHIFKPALNARKYIVNDSCNTCGVCAQVCPAKNVAVSDKVSFGDHCEGCLACLHLCPQGALHVKGEKSDRRWRNPEVTLKEIIASNDAKETQEK